MNKYFILFLKVMAAIIMLQTLFFKFTGAQQSIDLFTKLAGEHEAFMRIGTGILELIASILLFIPTKNWLGAGVSFGLMTGAVMSHLTQLGIAHNNDGGTLFTAAIVVLVASAIILWNDRKNIPIIGEKF